MLFKNNKLAILIHDGTLWIIGILRALLLNLSRRYGKTDTFVFIYITIRNRNWSEYSNL